MSLLHRCVFIYTHIYTRVRLSVPTRHGSICLFMLLSMSVSMLCLWRCLSSFVYLPVYIYVLFVIGPYIDAVECFCFRTCFLKVEQDSLEVLQLAPEHKRGVRSCISSPSNGKPAGSQRSLSPADVQGMCLHTYNGSRWFSFVLPSSYICVPVFTLELRRSCSPQYALIAT